MAVLGAFIVFFCYICKNNDKTLQVFVRLADEPRKFIYGKRGQYLPRFCIVICGYSVGCCFFFLPQVFLGPISGD